jgi:hypothetical protein
MLAVVAHDVAQQTSSTLKIGQPSLDETFDKLISLLDKTRNQIFCEIFFTSVGAVASVAAAVREKISRKGGDDNAGFVPFGFQDRQDVFDNFLEGTKWGGGHCPPPDGTSHYF